MHVCLLLTTLSPLSTPPPPAASSVVQAPIRSYFETNPIYLVAALSALLVTPLAALLACRGGGEKAVRDGAAAPGRGGGGWGGRRKRHARAPGKPHAGALGNAQPRLRACGAACVRGRVHAPHTDPPACLPACRAQDAVGAAKKDDVTGADEEEEVRCAVLRRAGLRAATTLRSPSSVLCGVLPMHAPRMPRHH